MARPRRPTRIVAEPERLGRPFDGDVHDEIDAAALAREEAGKRGYEEGRKRAEEELVRELEQLRGEAAAAMKRLVELERTLTRQHEKRLLDIAIEAASRIVRQRIESGDPVAARTLREALDALPVGARVRARLNPEDVEPVGELLHAEIDAGKLELDTDPSVSRGGCVVESTVGAVDATLETAESSAREAACGTTGQA